MCDCVYLCAFHHVSLPMEGGGGARALSHMNTNTCIRPAFALQADLKVACVRADRIDIS